MTPSLHPAAPHHLPFFITAPGETDVLMVVMAVFLALPCWVGMLFLRLHTLPERMAHKSQKLQFEIVAVLGLLALFTHMHIFWVAGLLLALIDLPDSATRCAGSPARSRKWPASRRAESEDKAADRARATDGARTSPELPGEAPPAAANDRRSAEEGAEPCLNSCSARCSRSFPTTVPALCPGQAVRQGDHAVLRLVRAALGHRRLPHADDRPDHGDLLQPPLDHQRHLVLQDHPDPARRHRARRRDLCRA